MNLAELGAPFEAMVIAGRRRTALSGDSFETLDPGRGEPLGAVPAGGAEDVDLAVQDAKAALKGPWRDCEPKERGRLLRRVAELMRAGGERLAKVESLDSGKPISAARRDVARSADYFDYYAGLCDKLEGTTIPLGRDKLSYTLRAPLGVTAHIVPWNVPLPIAARGLAPALACGNTAVVKPAEETPLSAVILAEILLEAGLPPGVCNVVTGTGEAAGAPLARHPDIAQVTFTGSRETGVAVMKAAAEHVAAVTLELGGKSPVVVLGDADPARAVAGVLKAFTHNAGQICSAGTRLVVERQIHDQLLDGLGARARGLSLGHGLDDPALGPLISETQRNRVSGFVAGARDRGLALVTGGAAARVDRCEAGFFYQPTILDQVPPEDEIAQEEVFGPVLCVQPVDSLEEAIAIANGTRYGLAAGIYTQDISKALIFAREVEAGQVFINGYHNAGDTVPFGGFKESGTGREKGLAALANYCQIKAVTVDL
ncbi:MAG: aldehyde dehydrogenase family protein [Pseudomonadota bacterium]